MNLYFLKRPFSYFGEYDPLAVCWAVAGPQDDDDDEGDSYSRGGDMEDDEDEDEDIYGDEDEDDADDTLWAGG